MRKPSRSEKGRQWVEQSRQLEEAKQAARKAGEALV